VIQINDAPGNIAYRTGRRLHINPETEGFAGDDEASGLVKRADREPWVIPGNLGTRSRAEDGA